MGLFSKKKEKKTEEAVETIKSAVVEKAPVAFEGIDPEVVAAITAAVYAVMGTSNPLIVRNIVRVNDTTPIWARVARRDVMSSRL